MTHTVMQVGRARLVGLADGSYRIERRLFGFWFRVKRLPVRVGKGLVLDEAQALQTAPDKWHGKMVWSEKGDAHFMAET